MLSVYNLTIQYPTVTALDGVSLEVKSGEIVAVLGPNGAGKSTLIRAISRQLPVAQGDILFEGRSIVSARIVDTVNLGIIQCPEGRMVFGSLTVEENLRMGAMHRDLPFRKLLGEFDKIWELFPRLKHRKSQQAGTLSGGEQQMLALARSLIGKPRLLLLDEPALGLSPKFQSEVYELIHSMSKLNMGILLVEQMANIALSIATRALLLDGRRIIASGTPDVIKKLV